MREIFRRRNGAIGISKREQKKIRRSNGKIKWQKKKISKRGQGDWHGTKYEKKKKNYGPQLEENHRVGCTVASPEVEWVKPIDEKLRILEQEPCDPIIYYSIVF